MNPLSNSLKSLLRHALTAVAGFGSFLLSKGLISADQVSAVDGATADAITALFVVLGALLARLLIWAAAKWPLLSFLADKPLSFGETSGSGQSGSSGPLALFLLCAIGASFALQFLTSCEGLSTGSGRLFIDSGQGAKGGLNFDGEEVTAFGRVLTADGQTVEVEVPIYILPEVDPAK